MVGQASVLHQCVNVKTCESLYKKEFDGDDHRIPIGVGDNPKGLSDGKKLEKAKWTSTRCKNTCN